MRYATLFLMIALAVLFFMLATGFKANNQITDDPVKSVQSEILTHRNVTNIVVADGQIEPVARVTISPEVSGEIIELPVKEGQFVRKGDLLVKINPDIYTAALNQAKASYASSLASKEYATASFEKAEADYQRNLSLFNKKLLSESDFIGSRAARDMARAQLDIADDQIDVAKATAESAEEQLARTTIISPLTGTITKLNSEVGEGVLGTIQNTGTEIMTISDLNEMEARVEIGEMDVTKIAPGQKARLYVHAFKGRIFNGVVTDVANSSVNGGSSGPTRGVVKYQVRIRFKEKAAVRSGMSVGAEIETTLLTNVLVVHK